MTPRMSTAIRCCRTVLVCAAFSSLLPGIARGQQDPLDRVAALVERGQLEAAEAILDGLLAADPSDFDARIQRGNIRSLRGNYAGAREDFGSALATRPGSYAAYLGTAWAFAWEGNYPNATGAFEAALQVQPAALEPRKGLAYVALWGGDTDLAMARFQALADANPDDPEFLVGMGQTMLADGEPAEAAELFRQAQAIDPSSADAREGLESALFTPPRLGVHFWGGYTGYQNTAEDGTSGDFGLQLARVAYQASPRLRIWGQYNDGLALETRELVSGESFPAVTGGLGYDWDGRAYTTLEGGGRSREGNRQAFASFDQAFFLSELLTVRAVGFVGPREDESVEWYGGGGLRLRFDRVWIEGLAVLTDDGTDPGTGDVDPRGFSLVGQVGGRFGSGVELVAGGSGARSGVGSDGVNRLGQVYLKGSVAVATSHRIFAVVRHHRVRGPDDFTQFAIGVSIAAIK